MAANERDRRLQELIAKMAEVPAEERRTVLETLEDDSDLIDETLGLLAPEIELGDDGSDTEHLRRQRGLRRESEIPLVPGYEMHEVLGAGGMGRVYRATQHSTDQRAVAIKVIRAALPGAELIHRFTAERQALARLNHAAIAQLYEAGTTSDGRPYVVLEYVDGPPITEYCDQSKLGLRARLELFVAVCRGVEHAHRRQLLHRDLKPSNLLIATQDGRPVPKIIDFGIAKVLDSDHTLMTDPGMMGTPAYMSPESLRVSDEPLDLDTRADVYSLGVVLYELLVGVRPFKSSSRTDPVALVHSVLHDDVTRPSKRLGELDVTTRSSMSTNRGGAFDDARGALSGDLDWITMKAIAKDREDRYGSVAALADDLERHLRHEPVSAGPPTWRYRAGKFVRRYRLAVATAVLAVLALLAGVVGTTVGMVQARAAAEQEAEARREAEEIVSFLETIFEASSVDRKDSRGNPSEVTALDLLDQGAARIDDELEGQPVVAARLRLTLAAAYRSLGKFDVAEQLLLPSVAALAALEPRPGIDRWRAHLEAELGFLASKLGRWDEALERYETAEELALPAFQGHGRTLFLTKIVDRSARVLRRQARFDESEARQREAIALLTSLPEVDTNRYLSLVNNLGSLYFAQERWTEAEEQYAIAVDLARRELGEHHTRTAGILDNLGAAIASQDRLDEAAPLFADALAIRREILPEAHPSLAISLNNLGTLALDRERPEEAEAYHREALAIRRDAFGAEHPTTAWSHHGLALALDQLG
ncbi:MAG: serine/threonine-protein kinase, partial [Acidobacteriota bacterium]